MPLWRSHGTAVCASVIDREETFPQIRQGRGPLIYQAQSTTTDILTERFTHLQAMNSLGISNQSCSNYSS